MPAKTSPAKVGDIVECKFLDHMEDMDEPTEFALYGVLVKSNSVGIGIACWAYPDGEYHEDGNEKVFAVVRSSITSLRKLK